MPQPFFTIGVPTYNRHELLRLTLHSILAQTFSDFEVIVGNDYTAESLTGEMLGITDPRIRFVNHPHNLREVGNMNALLTTASGRYFTWLFDDDLYEPDFLQIGHDSMIRTGYPPAFFSSFRTIHNHDIVQPERFEPGPVEILSGPEFIRRYDVLQPYVISTCGFIETAAMRSIVGGVEELCASSIGLYCEYLLLVRYALLEKIAYVDIPLVIFRVHPDSWGEKNTELEKYLEAGSNLVSRSADVLRHPSLVADIDSNLMTICKIHLYTFATKSAMSEIGRLESGIPAAYRAVKRFLSESRKIRKMYAEQIRGYGLSRPSFLNFEIYCFRLILFKLRERRPENEPDNRSSQDPDGH